MTEVSAPVPASGVRLNRRAIPNVPVLAHDGREYRFFEDLVRDRTVLVAFMSIGLDAHAACTGKMAEVRALLDRDRADETLFLSITVDPERDDPLSLALYAGRAGAGGFCAPGKAGRWLFLTAAAADVEALRAAFYVHRSLAPVWRGPKLISRADLLRLTPEKAATDCSMGLMRYGNEALDIWGGAPIRASARDIAKRLDWIRQRTPRPSMARRRGGPMRA